MDKNVSVVVYKECSHRDVARHPHNSPVFERSMCRHDPDFGELQTMPVF